MRKDKNAILFLGQGVSECVAAEGCLKMKELTYIHCQVFSINNIANNLFNFVNNNPGIPAIWIVLDSDPTDKEVSLEVMRKLLARGFSTFNIIISDCEDQPTQALFNDFCGGNKEQIFYIPKSGEALSALICIIPLQKLAYDTTIALGYNPDRPKNLAKEVTVK